MNNRSSKQIYDSLSFDYGVDCTINRPGSAPAPELMDQMLPGTMQDPLYADDMYGDMVTKSGQPIASKYHSTGQLGGSYDPYGLPTQGTAPVTGGLSTNFLENFGLQPSERTANIQAALKQQQQLHHSPKPQPLRGAMQELHMDFTRPEGSRTRPLLVEGRSLYVCEHYMSIWSPVLKQFIIECPNRELILPNIRFEHMLEVLECISPMHKEINEKNLHYILPIAAEFQMEGLLHRCELYLVDNLTLPILEKLWLGDRYKLKRLVVKCMTEIRPQSKIDISGPKYYTLSDRVKVQVLERIHGSKAPEPVIEAPVDASAFIRLNEVMYCAIKGKTGRAYYTNPYYLAAWSNVIAEKMVTSNLGEFTCGCTQEELKLFLMAVYPPQLRITENNVAPILMGACKLESPGLMRRCATMILNPVAQLTVFAKLSLLDRCFMHDLLETCLKGLRNPEQALEMTQQGHYDCLSVRARAALLDRLADLLKNPGLAPHRCYRCSHTSTCDAVNWVCPSCGSYCSASHNTENTMPPKVLDHSQYVGGASTSAQIMAGPGTMGVGMGNQQYGPVSAAGMGTQQYGTVPNQQYGTTTTVQQSGGLWGMGNMGAQQQQQESATSKLSRLFK